MSQRTCWNVASATKPNNGSQFMQWVGECAAERNKLKLVAMTIAPGPGCNNYGMMLDGDKDEAEKFVHAFTMAVQPAKFCQLESDPELVAGEFRDYLNPDFGKSL